MKSKAEKKIVTLEKYYKVKLIGSACGFALALILAISNGILGTDTPFWFLPLVAVLTIPFFVCFVLIMIWSVSKCVEKHDEMSMQNLTKAHSRIFTGFSGLVVVAVFVSRLWTEPVQVNLDGNLCFIIVLGFYALYNACESGFFLVNEKKMNVESEDNDE